MIILTVIISQKAAALSARETETLEQGEEWKFGQESQYYRSEALRAEAWDGGGSDAALVSSFLALV